MSLLKAWSPYFQSSVRARGRDYHAEGRVTRLAPQPGELARATVQGSQPYTVVIQGEGDRLEPTCTCSCFAQGIYCKHIWATLLDLQEHPQSEGPAGAGEALQQAAPTFPKARKRSPQAPEAPRREPAWIGQLSLLRPARVAPEAPEPALPILRQVCYVIDPELSSRHGRLVVELYQRTPTPGGWSKMKRLRIGGQTIDELTDPLDRELGALLLGATWVSEDEAGQPYEERARSRFALQPGAWRALLARIAQSERGYIDVEGRPQPLTWADDPPQPWVLWMVGDLEDEELSVWPELRRGEAHMSVNRPILILGGADGVVLYDGQAAPFDDRGAFRWVTQFRDEYRLGDKAFSIRVPREDVERFLDRLYLLPYLPEMDLPPGIGRTAQRVAPVGHVALFSEQPVNGSRKQLGARVWFTYGQKRVRPGEPGQFLTAAIEPSGDAAPAEHQDPAEGESAGASEDPDAADATGTPDAAVDGEAEVSAAAEGGDAAVLVRRDLARERQALAWLVSLGFRPASADSPEDLVLPVKQMAPAVAALLEAGWRVTADEATVRHPGPPRLSVSSGIDWFELHGQVRFQTEAGEQTVSLPQILAAAREGRTMIELGDGTHGLLPEQWLRQHGLLTALGRQVGDHLRFHASQAALLDALLAEQELETIDEPFRQARAQLRGFSGIQPLEPPPAFHGELRPYQKEALGWLDFLRRFGMGGILADDMGLGKTVQVLAMLESRYRTYREPGSQGESNGRSNGQDSGHRNGQPGEHRPTLVVVPKSVIFNWIDEARRFAPQLRTTAYAGPERDQLHARLDEFDLVVTSYGLMRRDIEVLREVPFDYVVLDEAQAIKNPASQAAKAARLLQARHRLALTGTPVENHLGDLWSIFEFLNPGMLGSATRFGQLIRGSIGSRPPRVSPAGEEAGKAGEDGEISGALVRALRPFILRRTKQQVLRDLPEKTEQTIVCEMEGEQLRIYRELREHYRAALLGDRPEITDTGLGGATMMVLEALLRLRQAACHPGLIDPQRVDQPSAKLDALLEHLGELIDEGHKALVFSQFTSMLAIVRRRLEEMGVAYEYLDGQTRDRKARVERFQTDPDCPAFLISLKAGGLGLNLTAADYVFILDPWWNPAVEQQAIDRAHRIGQTRHVFAYRLICQDTVEQRIAELQQRKQKLAEAIVGGNENLLRTLTRDDLEELLR